MTKLTYKPDIAPEVLSDYCDIMVAGNTALQTYHARLKEKFPSRAKFRGAIFQKVDSGNVVRFGNVTVRKADLEKIVAVRAIEIDMLEAFAGVVYQQANAWHNDGNGHTIDDLEQEAASVLLDAIYYYTNPRIKFITYATDCIRNRMISFTNTGDLIALPDNADNRDLLRRYDEAFKALAERANFDSACDFMGATKDEKEHLRDMLLATTVSQNDIESGQRDSEATDDFTAMSRPVPVAPSKRRAGYFRHSGSDNNLEQSEADLDRVMAVQRLVADADNMPEFDRAVLFAAMEGEYGWQAAVASRYTNKATGRPYTRASVRWVMQRIGEQIEAIVRGDDDLASDAA